MPMARNYTKKGQIHHKIASVLKIADGPLTTKQLEDVFEGTMVAPTLYRLSTYIWNIKQDGGVVRVAKNGRKIVSYELMNRDEFDDNGFFIKK